MKKFIFTLLVLGMNFLFAQEIVKLNQEKPSNKNAGRVIKLKKVLQIGDEDGEFLFSQPFALRVADDGSFYVMEFNKLFKFDAKGKPLKSLCKLGEGPGEVGQLRNFLLYENSVIMYGIMPKKVIWLDKEGNFLSEFKVWPSMLMSDLIMYREVKYYFLFSKEVQIKKEPYFADIDNMISELSADKKNLEPLISFPVKTYIMALGEGGQKIYSICPLKAEIYQGHYLIISTSPGYLLKCLDMKEKKVTHTFSRVYQKVKYKDSNWGKDPDAPVLDYENDIKRIFPQKTDIWIETSTKDEKKGILIDVFDSNGTYTDSFFIKVKGRILCIHDGYVFTCEQDKDFNPLVVQYRISDR